MIMMRTQTLNRQHLTKTIEKSVLSEISGLADVFLGVQMKDIDDDEDLYGESGRVCWLPPLTRQNYQKELIEKLLQVDSSAQRRPKKQIQFSTISIRHYEQILTENPSTIRGPPVGIGWRYLEKQTELLTDYETARGPPRPSPFFVLNDSRRENMILELGYTRKDIATVVRSNLKSRNQRRQTVQNLSAEKFEEALEGAGKRVKRILKYLRKRPKRTWRPWNSTRT